MLRNLLGVSEQGCRPRIRRIALPLETVGHLQNKKPWSVATLGFLIALPRHSRAADGFTLGALANSTALDVFQVIGLVEQQRDRYRILFNQRVGLAMH